MSIIDPLSASQLRVLRAYVLDDVPSLSPAERHDWAEATQALVDLELLQRADRGILVTPEGLAACLDIVPAELMRTEARSAAT